MIRVTVAVISLFVLAPQGEAQPSTPALNWSVANLKPGSEVRVTLAAGKTVHGFLEFATADSMIVNGANNQERLARPDIQRVQVKLPGHRGRNTLVGLAIGAGAGFAGGAAADHSGGPGRMFPSLGKVVFTPIGAIIGTVVGVAIPTGRWRDTYRVR